MRTPERREVHPVGSGRVKVAHVTTTDMSLRYLLLNQLRSLASAGYDVVGVSSPGPDVRFIEANGIRHMAVRMTRRKFSPLADLHSLWRLYRVMRRGRFTIVHTHTVKAGILGRFAARLAQVPVIVHTSHGFIFHDASPWHWRVFFMALEKILSRCCDLIFSVSNEDIVSAADRDLCDPRKLVSLGEGGIGIDIGLFNPERFSRDGSGRKRRELGLPESARVVGFVGRLVGEKGVLELFEAARIVRGKMNEDVRFLIIGPVESARRDAVTPDSARKYGISDVCVFTGVRQDMPELYSVMDLLVLPSHREGFPLVLAEAAAMGVPVIATNIRGCREAVEQGRNGVLVPLGDVRVLADAMIELLTDRDRAQRMGEEGRRVALERFDERPVFEKVKSEYSRLLRQKGLPVPLPMSQANAVGS